MRLCTVLCSVALVLTACPEEKAAPPAVKSAQTVAPPPARMGKVTVLITGHETGSLPAKGPRVLAQWKKLEHWPDALAFSTGDSFSGAVLSSHFFGASSAEVMKAMQYKASSLGNHDLDLGLDTLRTFRDSSAVTMLAANLKDKADAEAPLHLMPSAVFTRENVKVGVVGFTSPKTLATTIAGRASGLELLPLEASVGPALESLKKDAPDVVVALIDDCFTALEPTLSQHPEWKVDLVVGTRCPGAQENVSGATKYYSVSDDLTDYIAAAFELKGEGKTQMTAVRRPIATTEEEDQDLVNLRSRWQQKLDEELGQTIGFSKTGFKDTAPQLRTLVATALRDAAKADAAMLNTKGVRAALPKGPITRAAVYNLIPFENAVVTVKVRGETLTKLKNNPAAFMLLPAKVEPDQTYVLATIEYLYFGGDGLGLEGLAPEPELTGQVWQTPVIEWISKQASDERKPLENLLK
jgi:5'-nucleotidase / UDP-sugar diphosphatase